jgi:drug/metabolite transporter (DMT)-like permease
MGIVNTALPFTLISWGETRIDSALASILNGTVPLFTIVIAHFWLHDERITLPRIAGLVVGFIGIVVLVSRDLRPDGLHGNVWGQLAIIAASISYATGITFSRRHLRGQHPVVQPTVSLSVAASLMWLSFPLANVARQFTPMGEPMFTWPALPITWLSIVWLGLLGTCLAYILFFYLINAWGPTRASVVTYVFPVIGLVLGIVFLQEAADWRLLAGSALIVGGIAVVNLRPRQRSLPAQVGVAAD